MLNKDTVCTEQMLKRAAAALEKPVFVGLVTHGKVSKGIWKVKSQSKAGMTHMVEMTLDLDFSTTDFVENHGLSFKFICSCEASTFGNYCIHCMIVRKFVNFNWIHWFKVFAPDLERAFPDDPKNPAKTITPFLEKLINKRRSS